MVPGWWWIWNLKASSFCSMRTPVQVVMSWVTWKRSGFVFLLGSMSSRTGWWSWSSNCRSPSKRYNSTGSHGKWFKFDPNKHSLRWTWKQITITVTPLIAVSTKQSKLVQFAFGKMFSNLLILSTESQSQLILVLWLTDGGVFVLSSRLRWSAPCCRARGRPSSIRWRQKRTSSLSCSTS